MSGPLYRSCISRSGLPGGWRGMVTPAGSSDLALHLTAWTTLALKSRAHLALQGIESPTEVHATPAAFLANVAETFFCYNLLNPADLVTRSFTEFRPAGPVLTWR